MISGFLDKFLKGAHSRSSLILKNIIWSAGLKVVNASVSFIVVPLYLTLLTDLSFGIWLTVSAVLQWFNFFDLGIGNGLRNKLAEALASSDRNLGRVYVSTTYVVVSIIAIVMLTLFLATGYFVDWSVVFEAPVELEREVNLMVSILFILFVPQFVVQLIKMIVTADQLPALSNLMNTIVNVLQLAGVYTLVLMDSGSLVNLAWIVGGINLLVPLIASTILFAKRYNYLRPSFSRVDFSHAHSLMGLGATFFILQGAALVVFMTDNLIITKVLGPDEVPAYNISYRYFNLALVFFTLITAPFWSAFTEAYVKKDFIWIKRTIRRLLGIWGVTFLVVVSMIFLAEPVYALWIGEKIEIPTRLNYLMGLWVALSALLSIFGTFLSGTGKLRISLVHAVLVMIINIPLSIWLAGFDGLGSGGVILASILGASLRLLFQPYQTFALIRRKAEGIWDR